MSTLLSTDIKWEKPSTKRFAPPGGKTSISLGNYSEDPLRTPTKGSPPAPVQASPIASPPTFKASAISSSKTPSSSLLVGIAVQGTEPVRIATRTALSRMGAEVVLYEVSDPLQLPFAAQCLISDVGVSAVIAIGSLTDFIAQYDWGAKEVAQALVQSLLHLSLAQSVPVVNGLCFKQHTAAEVALLGGRLASGAISLSDMKSKKVPYSIGGPSMPPVMNSPRSVAGKKSAPVERNMMHSRKGSTVFEAPRTVPQDLTSLMLGLRTSLNNHGAKGIFGLARKFRIGDADGSGEIDFHEFQVCMRDTHMGWTEDELKNVFELFDDDHTGSISYDEFLFAVRGELNDRRGQIVLEAFALMDIDQSGVIEAEDIKSRYNAKEHPDVKRGVRPESTVLEEFLSTFEDGVPDGKVHAEEWCRYYSMVSSSIDDDDYFELMMRNAWHMSGGEGACANTTCRRVLATRPDGTQTVEEIENDLGIDPTDTKAMLANLRAQGFPVTSVSLFGTLDTTEPQGPSHEEGSMFSESAGRRSPFTPRVRQGPGGNSSLVLG